MQDRPTSVELLKAAREFCERDLLPALSGRVRFHARVMQNVLAILEREWEGEEPALQEEWRRLQTLLDADDDIPRSFSALRDSVRERNTELGKRIRSGEMDDRWAEVLDALRATIAEKLAIANPGYASSETSTGASTRSTR
jgi:hypothetical protein